MRERLAIMIVGVVLGAFGAVVTELVLRSRGSPPPTVMTGTVYASPSEATIVADGAAYSVPGDIPWYDSSGQLHLGGRPSCVPATGVAAVRFAGGQIELADNGAVSTAFWVRC